MSKKVFYFAIASCFTSFIEGDVFKIIVPLDDDYSFDSPVPQGVPQDLRKIILEAIKENDKISREELANRFNVSVKTIARNLKKMEDKVKYDGSGYSGHWIIKK